LGLYRLLFPRRTGPPAFFSPNISSFAPFAVIISSVYKDTRRAYASLERELCEQNVNSNRHSNPFGESRRHISSPFLSPLFRPPTPLITARPSPLNPRPSSVPTPTRSPRQTILSSTKGRIRQACSFPPLSLCSPRRSSSERRLLSLVRTLFIRCISSPY
jgi:hypothetical protein